MRSCHQLITSDPTRSANTTFVGTGCAGKNFRVERCFVEVCYLVSVDHFVFSVFRGYKRVSFFESEASLHVYFWLDGIFWGYLVVSYDGVEFGSAALGC